MDKFRIGNQTIGPDQPCFVIAEVGVNHNGSLELAKRLVDVAAEAGADAVKFQTYKADQLVTDDAPMAEYQVRNIQHRSSQLEMLRRLELSVEAHRELWDYCKQKRILFLSSPFESESADFLETLGVLAFKIPSGEITNTPFLEHVARKRRPMIVSTGMANLDEVRTAVDTIRAAGATELVLLQCVSQYPAPAKDVNLRAMRTMASAFGTPVGYSDHTLGIEVALASVALGACVLEKHFTLSRRLPGPDHAASLEPEELAEMMRSIRSIEAAFGTGRKEPVESEVQTALAGRKSLVAARELPAGAILTREAVALKRPGTGLPPARLAEILGRRLRSAVKAGKLFEEDDLEP